MLIKKFILYLGLTYALIGRVVHASLLFKLRASFQHRYYRTYGLTFFRWFWRLRQWAAKVNFALRKKKFQLSAAGENAAQVVRTVFSIFQVIRYAALLSVLLVGTLIVVEASFKSGTNAFQIFHPESLHWILEGLTRDLNLERFSSLLESITGVSGSLLGLYFASVTIVASTIYSHVPADIREIVVQEKIGNRYITLIAVLVAVGVGAL